MLMSKLIGHRGVASLAPENTLAGIRKAKEIGLEWIELDVTLLGDDQPVMIHDGKLNRTTDHRGHIKSFGLQAMNDVDAGSWFSNDFVGERVPTLIQTLELIKELGLGLNLELKVNRCNTRHLAYIAAQDLSHVEFPDDKLVVSSFNHKALRYFRTLSKAPIGCLFGSLPLNWQHRAKQVNARSIHVNGAKLTREKASAIKKAGYELYCYTVNNSDDAKQLTQWGVDGVFSDEPQNL